MTRLEDSSALSLLLSNPICEPHVKHLDPGTTQLLGAPTLLTYIFTSSAPAPHLLFSQTASLPQIPMTGCHSSPRLFVNRQLPEQAHEISETSQGLGNNTRVPRTARCLCAPPGAVPREHTPRAGAAPQYRQARLPGVLPWRAWARGPGLPWALCKPSCILFLSNYI